MSTLTDLYQILFGKNHIQDGSVIDMAEHGRQGGLSTKQGYKTTGSVQLTMRLGTNASLTFIGHAAPGVNASLPYWRIKAITADSNILYADGDDNFDNVWDIHTTYTYL